MTISEYIILALGCAFVGVVITLALIYVLKYFAVDVFANLWVVAIPMVLAVLINVISIEVYKKYRKR